MPGIIQTPLPASQHRAQARPARKVHGPISCRESGAIAIMLALLLPVILGFIAVALELGRVYNRIAEMQTLADSIAIAAAKKLNGTSDGISDALAAAHDVVESGDDASMKPRYDYGNTMLFSEAAIKFAKSPDGGSGWVDAGAAKVAPAGLAYVKVDTNDLNTAYGTIDLFFMRILNSQASMSVSHVAVAGRQRLNLTPLAICEMSKDPAQPFMERPNPGGYSELTEFGFRRGVSYNLLKLSPNTSSGVNYLVDPISAPPKSGNFSTGVVGPYVCTGTVELQKVIGKTLNLKSGFPITDLVNQLNSRFNLSNGQCSTTAAPPDTNTKQFTPDNINWMGKPFDKVADTATSANRVESIADLDPPNSQSPTHYGPLWVFSRPVPWSAYVAGQAEPAKGYETFQATVPVWTSLYSTGPALSGYPTDAAGLQSPPYVRQVVEPSTNYPGVMFRRVLNIPLLACPAAGVTGQVVAIGRFFMTVPADANGIYAEFAGVTLQEQASGPVELHR